MLLGAVIAVLVSAATGSWVVGLLAALAAGALLGLGFSLVGHPAGRQRDHRRAGREHPRRRR